MDTKVVALLELTGDTLFTDTQLAVTLKYIQNLNGISFPIVDTRSSLPETLLLLNRYYSQGYRVFIGFNECSILSGILTWFSQHPDCLGISPYSSCVAGEVVGKNIIRLQLSDRFNAFFMANFIQQQEYKTVVIVSESDSVSSSGLSTLLQSFLPSEINIVEISIRSIDSTVRTAISNVLMDLQPGYCIVNLVFGDTSQLLDLLISSDTTNRSTTGVVTFTSIGTNQTTAPLAYDILDPNPLDIVFTGPQARFFDSHYYHFQPDESPDTTNQELRQILGTSFSYNAYDCFNIARIATDVSNNEVNMEPVYSLVDHLLGHNGSLQLNNFNDRKFANYTVTLWQASRWNLLISGGNDPVFGLFVSNVTFLQRIII